MARIQNIELDRNLTGGDKFVGTDSSDNATVNFSIDQLSEYLLQTGYADPSRIGFVYDYTRTYASGNAIAIGELQVQFSDTAPANPSWRHVVALHFNATSSNGANFTPAAQIIQHQILKLTSVDSISNQSYSYYTVESVSLTGSIYTVRVSSQDNYATGNLNTGELTITPAGQSNPTAVLGTGEIISGTFDPRTLTNAEQINLGQEGDFFLQENLIDPANPIVILFGPKPADDLWNNAQFVSLRGPAGPEGPQGEAVSGVEQVPGTGDNPGDTTQIRFEVDGSTIQDTITIQPGQRGADGPAGSAGEAVSSVTQDDPNPALGQSTTLTFGTASNPNIGTAVLPAGVQGQQGDQGDQGVRGYQGGSTEVSAVNSGTNPGDTSTVTFTDIAVDATTGAQTTTMETVTIQPGVQGDQGIGIDTITGSTATAGMPVTVTVTLDDPAGTTPANQTFTVPAGAQGFSIDSLMTTIAPASGVFTFAGQNITVGTTLISGATVEPSDTVGVPVVNGAALTGLANFILLKRGAAGSPGDANYSITAVEYDTTTNMPVDYTIDASDETSGGRRLTSIDYVNDYVDAHPGNAHGRLAPGEDIEFDTTTTAGTTIIEVDATFRNEVASNTTATSTNAGNITTNTTNIGTNTTAISNNTTAITTNANDIMANGTQITTNRDNINTIAGEGGIEAKLNEPDVDMVPDDGSQYIVVVGNAGGTNVLNPENIAFQQINVSNTGIVDTSTNPVISDTSHTPDILTINGGTGISVTSDPTSDRVTISLADTDMFSFTLVTDPTNISERATGNIHWDVTINPRSGYTATIATPTLTNTTGWTVTERTANSIWRIAYGPAIPHTGTASVTEADFTINWTETSTGTTGTRPAMVTLTAEPQEAPDTREEVRIGSTTTTTFADDAAIEAATAVAEAGFRAGTRTEDITVTTTGDHIIIAIDSSLTLTSFTPTGGPNQIGAFTSSVIGSYRVYVSNQEFVAGDNNVEITIA